MLHLRHTLPAVRLLARDLFFFIFEDDQYRYHTQARAIELHSLALHLQEYVMVDGRDRIFTNVAYSTGRKFGQVNYANGTAEMMRATVLRPFRATYAGGQWAMRPRGSLCNCASRPLVGCAACKWKENRHREGTNSQAIGHCRALGEVDMRGDGIGAYCRARRSLQVL